MRLITQSTFAAVLFSFAASLQAASLLGVVKDPSGAVIPRAVVILEGPALSGPQAATTDARGRFQFDDLPPGAYQLRVMREGFDTFEQIVGIADKPVTLTISLKIKPIEIKIEVFGGQSPLKNSDANYLALRNGKLSQAYRVRNLILKRDAAAFTFRAGSFSFLPPVGGRVAAGVFVGEGSFTLKPATGIATAYMRQIAGMESVDEQFSSVVLYFSDETFDVIKQNAESTEESLKQHEEALKRAQGSMRMRSDRPISLLETLLQDDDVPNVEAELLGWVYNSAQRGSFRAFIEGRKYHDLRFIMNPLGAMPKLPAPEETALLNVNTGGAADGIWYLSHLASELKTGEASSSEDKRLLAPQHYRMEVTIGKDLRLSVLCELKFRVIREGTRVVKFDLLPDLQVTHVRVDGTEIPYIQEGRKKDGSFYIELPVPLARDSSHQVMFEYEGSELIRYAVSEYIVNPRRPWYPRSGLTGRATYDLTFKVPRGMMAVSVGTLTRKWTDGSVDAFQWSSDLPLPAAAFNYGNFMEKLPPENQAGGRFSCFLSALPYRWARPSSQLGLSIVENASRCFQYWFGALPYGRPNILQSASAESLPGLLFVPALAMDGYYLARFIGTRETIPQLVARQWWGNLVDPASFHDLWLSRGCADFATSLYDMADHPADFPEHWRIARNGILKNNESGRKINDAAPVWLGLMADINSTAQPLYGGRMRADFQTSANIIARKGAFVLHMLRCLMFDSTSRDQDFIAMMHDFASTYAHRSASTENFKAVVEKHMKPSMDLAGDGHMDWFFNEWVYEKAIPSYRLEYFLEPQKDGKQLLHGVLTQYGVPDSFIMRVPIFAKFKKTKAVPIGTVVIAGSTTGEFETVLPEIPKGILLNANYDVLTDRQDVKQISSPKSLQRRDAKRQKQFNRRPASFWKTD